MFRRIVCPTDFSEPSRVALAAAVELAAHFQAQLKLVNVVDMLPTVISDMGLGRVDLPRATQTALEDASRRLAQAAGALPQHVDASWEVRHGYVPEQIRTLAAEWDADLIVIATHGVTGWRHLMLGSVAEKVVQVAHCHVLTVRARDKAFAGLNSGAHENTCEPE